jgi:hypothetical protein
MKISVAKLDFDRSRTAEMRAPDSITFPTVGAADDGLWFFHTVNKTFYGWTGVEWLQMGNAPIIDPASKVYVDGEGTTIIPGYTELGQLRLGSLNTPPISATDVGTAGEVRWDGNYIYLCTATDTWRRSAHETWI